MIVHRVWSQKQEIGGLSTPWSHREGWFLFGVLPLYVRERVFR